MRFGGASAFSRLHRTPSSSHLFRMTSRIRPRGFAGVIALVLCGALSACDSAPKASPPAPSTVPDTAVRETTIEAVRDTLIRRGREDQDGRDVIPRALAANDTATLLRMMRADSARSRWLRAIVKRDGWPTRAAYGDSAAKAAWLILQHSPYVDFQEEMLPALASLASEGEMPSGDVAMLTDRVLITRGKPQRYGTQFDSRDGKLVAKPIEDMAGLEARRASVSMPPMSQYVKVLGEMYKMPVEWPPVSK